MPGLAGPGWPDVMGQYDDIDPTQLRASLVRFAALILRLEAEGVLLDELPRLQKALGDLRQRLFAYETRRIPGPPTRSTAEGPGSAVERKKADPEIEESLRIVREALEGEERSRAEWQNRGEDHERD